jgi:hypothetical protein
MCNPALNINKNISKAMKMYVASSAVRSNIEPKNPIVSDVRETARLQDTIRISAFSEVTTCITITTVI